MNNVERASFPGNKHQSAKEPNNCIRRFLINSNLPNKSESRGALIPLHFPIKMLFLGFWMPAEKPYNNQKSALQNTVTKKNDVPYKAGMELVVGRCLFPRLVFILEQHSRKEPVRLLFALAKSK